MPSEAIVMSVLGIVIFLFGVIFSIMALRNVKQHITYNLDGKLIEIITGFGFVKLVVDNKVIDELQSWQMHSAKLQGIVGEKQILVNIGSGFLKPKIMTFIDGAKSEELSNC